MAAEHETRVTFGSGMKYGLGCKYPFEKPMPPKPKKEPSSLRRVFTSPAVFEWIASDGRRGAATKNVNRHREKYIDTLQIKNSEKLPVEPKVNDKKSASVNGRANGNVSKDGTKKQPSKVGSKRSPSVFGWLDDLPDATEKAVSIAAEENNGFAGDHNTELIRMKTADMTWKEISEVMGKPPAELKARFKKIKPADFNVQPQGKNKSTKGKDKKKGKATAATIVDKRQDDNAWGDGGNDKAGGGAWGDNGDAGGGWGDIDGAAGDAGGDSWGNNDNTGGGWGDNNNDTGNNDAADGGWENQGWNGGNGGNGGNGSNKSHKFNDSKAGSNNGWAASGWDKGANINDGGSKKSSPSKSHKSNDAINLDSGGDDGGSGSRLHYRSATCYAGQVVVLVPDDTFSLSDLNLIARIIHTDARDIWFRISCAFGDKTGRRDLNPEAFERKITGQVKGKPVSRASSRR